MYAATAANPVQSLTSRDAPRRSSTCRRPIEIFETYNSKQAASPTTAAIRQAIKSPFHTAHSPKVVIDQTATRRIELSNNLSHWLTVVEKVLRATLWIADCRISRVDPESIEQSRKNIFVVHGPGNRSAGRSVS